MAGEPPSTASASAVKLLVQDETTAFCLLGALYDSFIASACSSYPFNTYDGGEDLEQYGKVAQISRIRFTTITLPS